ncbi:response regulator [Sabulilitoribacter arenilitoris]|uniref:histidine kinase n=1 Tax=Wocania arenilitoris TaxID=2044858 RepID=A0AAE3JNX9_9FLAO|nr:response regulator [Wocania arenilitoris]MCF7569136.1 response regulator [Wocania arenilitoris]
MLFFKNQIKPTQVKVILSVFVVIAFVAIFFVGFNFIDENTDLRNITLLFAVLIIVLVNVAFHFFKNQYSNELEVDNLTNIIIDLKQKLNDALDTADYKSIYLANMSHEIRTPLNTVLGMLNMLKQTNLDADQKAQVEIADYSSEHLLQLVNMIIDNSKVDEADATLNLAAINLKTDLSRLFKIFEYQAWDKGLELEFDFLFESEKKFYVLGDIAKIQQVLINLINNAIKFTNNGKITIIVDQTVGIEDDQIVTFYIKDTGVGMRSYEVKRILKNSKKVDVSKFNDYRGGGYGLLISRDLVKLMGGELKIESKENKGTTFYFSLQLKKTLNIQMPSAEVKPVLLNTFNVLVAEDNMMNQKVIKFLLEQQGADCTFAKNGLEAVDLYKILDFDMVFMDIYMPDLDGYQATEKIKRTRKYTKLKTPIIAVSASAFEEDIENAKLAGIDAFLAKPIEVDKLKKLLIKYASVDRPA